MNDTSELVEGLLRSPLFVNYERAYADLTGLPLSLRPLVSWQLPFHGRRNENSFCALMAEKSRCCSAFLELQGNLSEDALNKPATRTCSYGLCETAVPVRLGSETIGFLQTGQMMRQSPTLGSFQKAVRQAAKRGAQIDDEQTRAAYFMTPVVSARKLSAISRLLAIFAEHLSVKSNEVALQASNTEPPLVTKAKHFIRDNRTAELSLELVAKAVHTNRFNLCKSFKKSTGLGFTEYVSRTRIESAKQLLLNPNLRISEIAYESGFQSITHFNRMFKRVTGNSPKEYRAHLTPSSR